MSSIETGNAANRELLADFSTTSGGTSNSFIGSSSYAEVSNSKKQPPLSPQSLYKQHYFSSHHYCSDTQAIDNAIVSEAMLQPQDKQISL